MVHIDLAGAIASAFWFSNEVTFPIPIPNTNALRGQDFFAQTLHDEGTASLAASPLVLLTVL